MSYRQIIYHIVFATKNRANTLTDEYCQDLYRYMWGIVDKQDCKLYRINGVEDHIHLLSDLNPSLSLADFVKTIKVASSLWLKSNEKFPGFNGWQEGYGAFTCSWNDKSAIIEYIKNQKAHHKSETFFDEYRKLLVEHGIEFDPKFLL